MQDVDSSSDRSGARPISSTRRAFPPGRTRSRATSASTTCARCRSAQHPSLRPGASGDSPKTVHAPRAPGPIGRPRARGVRRAAIGGEQARAAQPRAPRQALPAAAGEVFLLRELGQPARSRTSPDRRTRAGELPSRAACATPSSASRRTSRIRRLRAGAALSRETTHKGRLRGGDRGRSGLEDKPVERVSNGLREVRPARDRRASTTSWTSSRTRGPQAPRRGLFSLRWDAFVGAAGRPAGFVHRSPSREPSADLESVASVRRRRSPRRREDADGRKKAACARLAWAGSHAMRPQLAMAALFVLVIGSGLLLLPGSRSSTPIGPVRVTERGEPRRRAGRGRTCGRRRARRDRGAQRLRRCVGEESPAHPTRRRGGCGPRGRKDEAGRGEGQRRRRRSRGPRGRKGDRDLLGCDAQRCPMHRCRRAFRGDGAGRRGHVGGRELLQKRGGDHEGTGLYGALAQRDDAIEARPKRR